MKHKHLGVCPKCKEMSVRVKTYEKFNEIRRVDFCINKGCKYKLDLPAIKMTDKDGVV